MLPCSSERDQRTRLQGVMHLFPVSNLYICCRLRDVQTDINLYPPVVVENFLPCPISTYVINHNRTQATVTVKDGESHPLYYVDPQKTITVSKLISDQILLS